MLHGDELRAQIQCINRSIKSVDEWERVNETKHAIDVHSFVYIFHTNVFDDIHRFPFGCSEVFCSLEIYLRYSSTTHNTFIVHRCVHVWCWCVWVCSSRMSQWIIFVATWFLCFSSEWKCKLWCSNEYTINALLPHRFIDKMTKPHLCRVLFVCSSSCQTSRETKVIEWQMLSVHCNTLN